MGMRVTRGVMPLEEAGHPRVPRGTEAPLEQELLGVGACEHEFCGSFV